MDIPVAASIFDNRICIDIEVRIIPLFHSKNRDSSFLSQGAYVSASKFRGQKIMEVSNFVTLPPIDFYCCHTIENSFANEHLTVNLRNKKYQVLSLTLRLSLHKTRKHSSRMRTARFSSSGGSVQPPSHYRQTRHLDVEPPGCRSPWMLVM